MRRVRAIGVMMAALVMVTVAAPAFAAEPAQSERIDAVIERAMKLGRFPGLAVAVEQNGQVIYKKGFGYADLERRIPATPDTVFPIGSITKSMTALTILQLVDEGRVALDAPLGRYLTAYDGPAKDVAIRHLLNHTSGVPNYTSDPSFPPDIQVKRTHEQVIGYVKDKPLRFAPGGGWRYSNTNTYLLGMVIEKVTGKPYGENLQARIFAPFGMTSSRLADFRPIIADRARGYEIAGDDYENAQQYDVDYPFSAGSVVSTVEDLLRYRRGVFEGSLTSEAVRRNVQTVDALNDGTPGFYALGSLIVRKFEGRRKISHSGVIEGFTAHYAYYPDDKLTIALTTNVAYPLMGAYAVERQIAREVLGLAQPKIVDQPLSKAEAAAYGGDFNIAPFVFEASRYGFVVKDGHLHMRRGGVETDEPLIKLLNQGGGKFVTAEDTEFTFQFSRSRPQADAVTVEWFDGSFPARRAKAVAG